jgi:hypothetical protein
VTTNLATFCCPTVKAGIFASGVSLRGFSRLFFLDNPEIKANQTRRWQLFLRAARNGTLLDRPRVHALWVPEKVYHPPMFGVLQSKYADVEHELNVMRSEYCNESVLFVAGGGQTMAKVEHTHVITCECAACECVAVLVSRVYGYGRVIEHSRVPEQCTHSTQVMVSL